MESEDVWSIILGFGRGSVQVYFPGQPSYSFPLVHSLAFGWELKRGTFPAPSPNRHRILGTFFVPLFSGVLLCRFQKFTYFELWSMPSNLCRTTLLSWDYRIDKCPYTESGQFWGSLCELLFFQGSQFYAVCRLMSENNFLVYFVQVLSFMVGGLIHFFPSHLEIDVHSMSSCMLIVFCFVECTLYIWKVSFAGYKIFGSHFLYLNIQLCCSIFLWHKVLPLKKKLIKIEFSFPFKSQIKGSVQVYFPGQPSYSFLLMHSLAPGWELKRGTFFDGFFFFKSCNFIRICLGFGHSGDWCSPIWDLLFQ